MKFEHKTKEETSKIAYQSKKPGSDFGVVANHCSRRLCGKRWIGILFQLNLSQQNLHRSALRWLYNAAMVYEWAGLRCDAAAARKGKKCRIWIYSIYLCTWDFRPRRIRFSFHSCLKPASGVRSAEYVRTHIDRYILAYTRISYITSCKPEHIVQRFTLYVKPGGGST